jgi:hypothetical protein
MGCRQTSEGIHGQEDPWTRKCNFSVAFVPILSYARDMKRKFGTLKCIPFLSWTQSSNSLK